MAASLVRLKYKLLDAYCSLLRNIVRYLLEANSRPKPKPKQLVK